MPMAGQPSVAAHGPSDDGADHGWAGDQADEHHGREGDEAGADAGVTGLGHAGHHEQRVSGEAEEGEADEDGDGVVRAFTVPRPAVDLTRTRTQAGDHCGSRPERASTCSNADAPASTLTDGPNRPGVPPSSNPPTNAMHASAVASSQS